MREVLLECAWTCLPNYFRFTFGDFDLIFGAARLNLKITDLPIRYRERTYGDIKIARFRHGWLLLKMSVFAARKLKFF